MKVLLLLMLAVPRLLVVYLFLCHTKRLTSRLLLIHTSNRSHRALPQVNTGIKLSSVTP